MLLISVSAGRFPRAWPQPPRRASSPVGSSAHAISAGVAVFHFNQLLSLSKSILLISAFRRMRNYYIIISGSTYTFL